MRLLGGPGTSVALVAALAPSSTLLVNGVLYWVESAGPEPGGGVPLGLFRYYAPPVAHATSGQKVPIDLVDEDTLLPKVGVSSPTVRISKNGSAFASASDGAWSAVGYGTYTVRLDERDTSDLGWAMIRVKASGSPETHVLFEVSISSSERRADYLRQRATSRG